MPLSFCFYSIPCSHWVATNVFESVLHQGRFLLQQCETRGEVFTVTADGVWGFVVCFAGWGLFSLLREQGIK